VVLQERAAELLESRSRRRGGRQGIDRVSHFGCQASGGVVSVEGAGDLLCGRERRCGVGLRQSSDQRAGVGVCDLDSLNTDFAHATRCTP
jgi:hypothetical protein